MLQWKSKSNGWIYLEIFEYLIRMDTLLKWTNLSKVLDEIGKVASGNLLKSVKYQLEYDDRSISLELSLEEYWKYIEYGRKPGKYPPPDKILEWVRIKPIVPDERNGRLPTEKQLTFLISRKIAEEGIEPGNQLRDALRERRREFEDMIEEAITKDITQSLDIIFSELFS